MSPEREMLLDDIEQSLWTLTEDNLRYLCERCGIYGSEVQGKSVRSLHRKIMKEYCENADLTESKGQGTSRLLQLKEDIKGIQEDASGAPTSPSQSATAEVGSSQACCDGEQHEEGGVWFPSRKLEADPVPQWLIIPQQRERVRGNSEAEPNSPLSFKSETKSTESLSPGCDGGAQGGQQGSRDGVLAGSLKRVTVLLDDCRFMLGQRVNIKVEEEEEMISVFANDGESSESSSPHSSQREKSSKKQSHLKRHLHTHSGETSSHCSG
ncbi:hypothetical protein J4Q44_G00220570 [Coregonus suidteri]|uniref:Uncharacterized protein n=1 Tax=Coregonus suidteri TaxID=861788 RepID=A0AAN8L8U8_9TELE